MTTVARPFARIGTALCLLLLAAPGLAQEKPRFPQTHITPQQWQSFLTEVKAKPGVQEMAHPESPEITVLAVESENTIYYFTKSGPAHPAVVIVRIIRRNGVDALEHSGYYAGAEQPFLRMFKAFLAQAEMARKQMAK